jgi:hypothetical protein
MHQRKTILKNRAMGGMAILPVLALTACMDQEVTRPADGQSGSAVREAPPPPKILEVEGEKYVRDEESGRMYLLNPNRRMVPQGSQDSAAGALMKSAGLNYTARDQSGLVEIAMWECVTPTRQETQAGVACQVDPNYVVVGGGARTEYFSSGALLTEARPFDNGLYTYVASSKSHKSSDPHYLHVYVIGLRLIGVTRNNLWLQTEFKTVTSSTLSETPTAQVSVSQGYQLIGGGARVNWSEPGNMLTESWGAGNGWSASGKSHKSSSMATISVWAIGLNPYIDGFGVLTFSQYSPYSTDVSTGVALSTAGVTSGYVLTCPSGRSHYYSGSGRLLTGIYPNPQFHGGAWASDKDHLTASDGGVQTRVIMIKKIW